MKKIKKTMEEVLHEQGMEQGSIYDILYPERKGAKEKDEKYTGRSEQSFIRTDGAIK